MRFRMKPGMGKHYTRQNGQKRVLRPGDEIDCERHQLGAVIWKFDQLEPDPPPPQPKVGLKPVHRGFGKWDVINQTTQKPINDKPLTKEEAFAMSGVPVLDATPPSEDSATAHGKEKPEEQSEQRPNADKGE